MKSDKNLINQMIETSNPGLRKGMLRVRVRESIWN